MIEGHLGILSGSKAAVMNAILPPRLMTLPPQADTTDHDTACAVINQCCRDFETILEALRRQSGGSRSLRRELLERALLSEYVRVAVLYRTLHKAGIRLGKNGYWTPQRVVKMGRGLNVYAPLYGPLLKSFVDKDDGEPRAIYRLAHIGDLARHRMALDLHRALQPAHPHQLAASGNGGFASLKELVRLHFPDAECVLKGDFPGCYPSIRKARVEADLLFRRKVTCNLLTRAWPDKSVGTMDVSPHLAASVAGRRRWASKGSSVWLPIGVTVHNGLKTCAEPFFGEYGVPPGVPLAALTADMMLGPVVVALESAAPGVVALFWVDDFLIILPRAEYKSLVFEALASAVRDRISESAAEELTRRTISVDPKAGFEFLGFHIQQRGEEVHFEPGEGFWNRLKQEIMSEHDHAPHLHDTVSVRERLMGRLTRYDPTPSLVAKAVDVALDLKHDMLLKPLPEDEIDDPHSVQRIRIYTDGACVGTPGAGGWAYVYKPQPGPGSSLEDIVLASKAIKLVERAGRKALATNNEMELTAVLHALRPLPKGTLVTIVSDSRFVVDGARDLPRRIKARFRRKCGKRYALSKLWLTLARELERLDVRFEWIKGHAGNTLNERADKLAEQQARIQHKRNAEAIGGDALWTDSELAAIGSSSCP